MSDNLSTSKQVNEFRGAASRGTTDMSSATSTKMVSLLDREFCVEVMIPNGQQEISDMLELQDLPQLYQPALHKGTYLAIRMDVDEHQWDLAKVVRRLPSIIDHPDWKNEAGYHVIRTYSEDGSLGQVYLVEMLENHSWEGLHHISSKLKMQSLQERLCDPAHPYNQLPTLQMYLLEDHDIKRLDEQVPDMGDDSSDPVDQAIIKFIKEAKVIEEGRELEMPGDLFVGIRRLNVVEHSPQGKRGNEE